MSTKAVIFDFDGTLTKPHRLPNSWARVWDRINCNHIDEVYYNQYKRGEITYKEWFKLCFACFKEHGVSMDDFVAIADEIELVDFIEEYFEYLFQNDVKIFILSGGVGNIIEYKMSHLKKYITSLQADMFKLDEFGKLSSIDESTSKVGEKSTYVNSIMDSLKLNKDEVVFIGNGANDEEVYLTGVKTICVNPDSDAHPENRTFWTEVILKCEDIRETLNFIDIKSDKSFDKNSLNDYTNGVEI